MSVRTFTSFLNFILRINANTQILLGTGISTNDCKCLDIVLITVFLCSINANVCKRHRFVLIVLVALSLHYSISIPKSVCININACINASIHVNVSIKVRIRSSTCIKTKNEHQDSQYGCN